MEPGKWTLSALAKEIPGAEPVGDGEMEINGVCSLSNPRPGCLSFVEKSEYLAGKEAQLKAGGLALLAPRDLDADFNGLRVPNPKLAFVRALELLSPPAKPAPGLDPRAALDPSAKIDSTACVGPMAFIGPGARVGARAVISPLVSIGENAVVGDDTVIYPLVSVYPRCRIGSRCIIHSGVVLGADGYSFVESGNDLVKVPQVGGLVVEDDVEIGANTCIDRGAIDDTVIGKGAKFDNLVQIGHNCVIGPYSRIVSQVGISGSCTVGEWTILAGQTGVTDHVKIGPRVIVGGRGGVTKDLPGGEFYSGFPARPHRETVRIQGALKKLPDYLKVIQSLETRIAALEAKLSEKEK